MTVRRQDRGLLQYGAGPQGPGRFLHRGVHPFGHEQHGCAGEFLPGSDEQLQSPGESGPSRFRDHQIGDQRHGGACFREERESLVCRFGRGKGLDPEPLLSPSASQELSVDRPLVYEDHGRRSLPEERLRRRGVASVWRRPGFGDSVAAQVRQKKMVDRLGSPGLHFFQQHLPRIQSFGNPQEGSFHGVPPPAPPRRVALALFLGILLPGDLEPELPILPPEKPPDHGTYLSHNDLAHLLGIQIGLRRENLEKGIGGPPAFADGLDQHIVGHQPLPPDTPDEG